jgi:hypothetical protein
MHERRSIGPRDLLEALAIVGLLLAVTLGAHGQSVQPLSNPPAISISHDRTATAVSLNSERELPDLGTESVASGEQPVIDYAPSPKTFVSLGQVAKDWREGRGNPNLVARWMPWDK